MPPRKRQTAKTRQASAAKAKTKKAVEEKAAEPVVEESEDTSVLEDSQNTSVTEESQESAVAEESQDTSVVEEQETAAEEEQVEQSEDAEPEQAEEEVGAEEEEVEEESAVQEEPEAEQDDGEGEEILEEGDVDDGGEEPGDEILEEGEGMEVADTSGEQEAEAEEMGEEEEQEEELGEEEEQEEEPGEGEEEEVTAEQGEEEEGETEEAGGTSEGGAEESLFTIDKTPMDIQEVKSKIVKEKKTAETDKKATSKKTKKAETEPKGKPDEKDKEKKTEKDKEQSKAIPLRGRVLRLHPVRLRDLATPAAAAILRQSIGYSIRSMGVRSNTRTLEIWFHSPEEADEMFVKFCGFKWSVNDRKTQVGRLNEPSGVDVTLKEWDQRISPCGLYDGRCVFVGNLPADAAKTALMAEFELARNCQIPTDKDGNNEGYALLEFPTSEEAVKQSKRTVKLGENDLTLHTIGMKRAARSKEEQEKFDQDMKRLRKEGIYTDFAEKKSAKKKNVNVPNRPGNPTRGNQRPGRGNKRPNQPNQRPGQGNQRQGQGPGNRRMPGAGNQNFKRRTSGGHEDTSPTKRGRMDRGRDRNPGRGGDRRGMMRNQEMQLRQEMLMAQQSMAQQSMLAQQMAQQSGMNMNRGMMGGGGRSGDDLSNIRGELLGQMQNLQQGGMTDPAYLMALAQRLQQAQGGGRF